MPENNYYVAPGYEFSNNEITYKTYDPIGPWAFPSYAVFYSKIEKGQIIAGTPPDPPLPPPPDPLEELEENAWYGPPSEEASGETSIKNSRGEVIARLNIAKPEDVTAAIAAEAQEREQGDAGVLEAALEYTDQRFSGGADMEAINPSVKISGRNWNSRTAYNPGDGGAVKSDGVNYNFAGFTCIMPIATPAEGDPDNPPPPQDLSHWQPEADYHPPIGSTIIPWGRDDERGFIVLSSPGHPEKGSIGFVRSKAAPLLEETIDYVRGKIAAWDGNFPFNFPTANDDGGMWHAIYQWPYNGTFQVYYYSDGTQQWVDMAAALGVSQIFDKDSTGLASQKATTEFIKDEIKKGYGVGSIYLSVNQTNPAGYLGFGTWELFGKGRVLVGVNPDDPVFNVALNTGGEKEHTLTADEMPTHSHPITSRGSTANGSGGQWWSTNGGSSTSAATSANAGGGRPHNNMPPWIAVYMWRRTA